MAVICFGGRDTGDSAIDDGDDVELHLSTTAHSARHTFCPAVFDCSLLGLMFNSLCKDALKNTKWEFPKMACALFWILIKRILLFRVLYLGPLFSETPKSPLNPKPPKESPAESFGHLYRAGRGSWSFRCCLQEKDLTFRFRGYI